MNQYFIPSKAENYLVSKLTKVSKEDFAIIRLTKTMLNKSIIDASESIRYIVEQKNVIDYKKVDQGEKFIGHANIILEDDIIETKVSYYRPITKTGDPRFWIYSLTKYVNEGQLLYITVLNRTLIVIPVSSSEKQLAIFLTYIEKNSGEQEILKILKEKIHLVQRAEWIPSVSLFADNPKDVGDSLEAFLNIKVNNLPTPDFMGKIELKSKRTQAKTLDSLFSKVPDWEISNYKSVIEIVNRFGYIKADKSPMKRLYNDINATPNSQGLFLQPQDENSKLFQKFDKYNIQEEVCAWWYSTIRNTLETKHPTTLWIDAEAAKIHGKYHFKYINFELSSRPIFSEFIRLIKVNIIVFDWKAKINPNGTSIRNHGPGFRIKPRHKDLLFKSLLNIT